MGVSKLDRIIELYKNPRNYGTIKNPTVYHEEGNPSCGDHIRIDVKVNNNKVSDIMFSGKGCAISMASASLLTDFVKGKSIKEAMKVSKEDVLKLIGIDISPVRIKCALLPLKVLKVALYKINQDSARDTSAKG